jgi:hypothetical protein
MRKTHFSFLGAVALAAALATPLVAQKSPFTEHVPTEKDPLRFSAFAVQMEAGMSGVVDIAIERWTTDAERQALLALVNTTTDKPQDQDKLLKALQDVKPRVGFIRTPNSMGWDLKYAYESQLPDGSRQIVIATDKPVSFLAAASQARTMDYAFSLIEMRFPAGSNKGEGKLLGQSSIAVKNGKLEVELYGQQPTRLTTITEQKDKAKK